MPPETGADTVVGFKEMVGAALNTATQERAAVIVTTPPVQPVPLQPPKVDPLAGVAVSVTTVPLA